MNKCILKWNPKKNEDVATGNSEEEIEV